MYIKYPQNLRHFLKKKMKTPINARIIKVNFFFVSLWQVNLAENNSVVNFNLRKRFFFNIYKFNFIYVINL